MSIRDEIELASRDSGGLIAPRDHPRWARSVQRLAGRGELHSPLAGIHCRSVDALEFGIRVRAAMLAAPDAVITGPPAAARLTFWPEVAVPVVTLSRRGRLRVRDGFRVCRERLPPQHPL